MTLLLSVSLIDFCQMLNYPHAGWDEDEKNPTSRRYIAVYSPTRPHIYNIYPLSAGIFIYIQQIYMKMPAAAGNSIYISEIRGLYTPIQPCSQEINRNKQLSQRVILEQIIISVNSPIKRIYIYIYMVSMSTFTKNIIRIQTCFTYVYFFNLKEKAL